jgi:hypothetical protein
MAQMQPLCDIDADILARFSRRYPSVTPSTRFEQLLEDPEIRLVGRLRAHGKPDR